MSSVRDAEPGFARGERAHPATESLTMTADVDPTVDPAAGDVAAEPRDARRSRRVTEPAIDHQSSLVEHDHVAAGASDGETFVRR